MVRCQTLEPVTDSPSFDGTTLRLEPQGDSQTIDASGKVMSDCVVGTASPSSVGLGEDLRRWHNETVCVCLRTPIT